MAGQRESFEVGEPSEASPLPTSSTSWCVGGPSREASSPSASPGFTATRTEPAYPSDENVTPRDRCQSWPLDNRSAPRSDSEPSLNLGSFAFAARAEGHTGENHTKNRHGLTFTEAVTTMIINCVGVGVVLLPKIMADVGMVIAPGLLILCALTCLECGVMVSTACTLSEKLTNAKVVSYEALALIVGGSVAKRVLTVTKGFAMMGFVIAYQQLVVDSIAVFFPGTGEDDEKPLVQIRFFMALPIFCVLSMCTNLKQLMPFSSLGVLAVVAKCGCIVLGGLWVMALTPPCTKELLDQPGIHDCRRYTIGPAVPNDQLPGTAGKYLAIFLFCFAILATVPSVRAQLADPTEMHSVLSWSFGIIVVIDLVVMSCGYLGFGVDTPDNIITGLAAEFPALGQASAISMIVNCLVSTPLFFYCIVTVFESSGGGAVRTPMTQQNILFRIALTVMLTLIGSKLPYVTEVIGLISSVFSCCNNIFFPALFHLLARRAAQLAPKNPLSRHLKYYSAVVVGLVVLVFGFQGSLNALLRKMAEEASCTTAGNYGVSGSIPCVFPFIYNGQSYGACTSVDYNTTKWCAVAVDSTGERVEGQWGDCALSCEDADNQIIANVTNVTNATKVTEVTVV